MESVGCLAGGIAHDFNNLLQAILGNAAMALQDLPPDSPLREFLEEIAKSGNRSADLCINAPPSLSHPMPFDSAGHPRTNGRSETSHRTTRPDRYLSTGRLRNSGRSHRPRAGSCAAGGAPCPRGDHRDR